MRVLFLDIDGVLATHQSWFMHSNLFIDTPDVCSKLDHFGVVLMEQLAESGVKIVLSSTWRLGSSLQELNEVFSFPIFDKTESLWELRGDDIHEWLSRHPEVEEYVIVDDDSDMLEYQLPHFVKIKSEEGITFTKATEICSVLGIDVWDLRVSGAPDV